jgi:hypothetical protein
MRLARARPFGLDRQPGNKGRRIGHLAVAHATVARSYSSATAAHLVTAYCSYAQQQRTSSRPNLEADDVCTIGVLSGSHPADSSASRTVAHIPRAWCSSTHWQTSTGARAHAEAEGRADDTQQGFKEAGRRGTG